MIRENVIWTRPVLPALEHMHPTRYLQNVVLNLQQWVGFMGHSSGPSNVIIGIVSVPRVVWVDCPAAAPALGSPYRPSAMQVMVVRKGEVTQLFRHATDAIAIRTKATLAGLSVPLTRPRAGTKTPFARPTPARKGVIDGSRRYTSTWRLKAHV